MAYLAFKIYGVFYIASYHSLCVYGKKISRRMRRNCDLHVKKL